MLCVGNAQTKSISEDHGKRLNNQPSSSGVVQNTAKYGKKKKKKKSGGNSFFFGTIMLAKKIGIHNIMQIKISPQLLKWHKNTKI